MFSLRRMPMWARYLTAFGVAAALIVAVIIYVDDHQSPLSEAPASPSKSELAQEQEQDYTLVQQEQAPHTTRLRAGSTVHAVTTSVVDYMTAQVNHGFIAGPYDSGSCAPAGGSPIRQLFHCVVVAAKLNYPFDAVVQPPAATITYCQVITPPIPSLRVPLSSRCL